MKENKENCIDIIRPFINELHNRKMCGDVQIVGGVTTFGLKEKASKFFVKKKLVVVPKDIDYSSIGQFREDGNLRDLDVFTKSTNPETLANVEKIAKDTIHDKLIMSVFGLHTHEELVKQIENPVSSLFLKVYLADRYVTVQENGQITKVLKALYPFSVEMNQKCLENWGLVFGDDKPIPIPHPGTVILNYLTRSVSGLRPKDAIKINDLSKNVFTKAPELYDWIVEGPGKSQLELANILYTLSKSMFDKTLIIGDKLEIKPQNILKLPKNPNMLIKNDQSAYFAVFVSLIKAQAVHFVEKHSRAVTFFQKYFEPHMDFIVKNRQIPNPLKFDNIAKQYWDKSSLFRYVLFGTNPNSFPKETGLVITPKLWSDFDGTIVAPFTWNPFGWSKSLFAGKEGYTDFLQGVQNGGVEIAGIVSRRPNIPLIRLATALTITKFGLRRFFDHPDRVILTSSDGNKGRFVVKQAKNKVIGIIDDMPHLVGRTILNAFLEQTVSEKLEDHRCVVLGVVKQPRSEEYINKFIRETIAKDCGFKVIKHGNGIFTVHNSNNTFKLGVISLNSYNVKSGEIFAKQLKTYSF